MITSPDLIPAFSALDPSTTEITAIPSSILESIFIPYWASTDVSVTLMWVIPRRGLSIFSPFSILNDTFFNKSESAVSYLNELKKI